PVVRLSAAGEGGSKVRPTAPQAVFSVFCSDRRFSCSAREGAGEICPFSGVIRTQNFQLKVSFLNEYLKKLAVSDAGSEQLPKSYPHPVFPGIFWPDMPLPARNFEESGEAAAKFRESPVPCGCSLRC
ncbi:hypothetical protein ACN2XU_04815, partial [Primorskyibacter sp. 2E107]|uniref:hypothetical protein n=1 Tax=Primorskyibacter sp. 2E107 TaxID=3403458 RepID=UPI003AF6BAAE